MIMEEGKTSFQALIFPQLHSRQVEIMVTFRILIRLKTSCLRASLLKSAKMAAKMKYHSNNGAIQAPESLI